MTDLLDRINRHIRQLAPHMMQREGVVLLREADAEIDRLLKIESDMKTLQDMYRRNSLSSYSDDMDELAKIMKPN